MQRLTLNIVDGPPGVVLEQRRSAGSELAIGRGPDCDWILADPDRVLSKRHCVLEFLPGPAGGWQVRDTSTNGTYLNRAEDPIGRDRAAPLSDRDRLRLGRYDIEVRIEADQPGWEAGDSLAPWGGAPTQAAPEPWGAPPPRDPWGSPEPAPDLWGTPPSPPGLAASQHGPGMSDAVRLPGVRPAAPLPEDCRFDLEMPGEGEPPPAPSARGGGLIPDDWDPAQELSIGGTPQPPRAPARPPPASPPPAGPEAGPPPRPHPADARPPPPPRPASRRPAPQAVVPPHPPAGADAAEDPDEAEAPFDEPGDRAGVPPLPPPVVASAPPRPPRGSEASVRRAASPRRPRDLPEPGAAPPEPPRAPLPRTPAPGDDGVDAAAALAALLRGAALPPSAIAPGSLATTDPLAALELAGAALRAAVGGLRALLIARADVKREFRIEQTMLRFQDNNPVKFAATDDAALLALIGDAVAARAGSPRGAPADGVAAIDQTVADLIAHQVASLAATQAAARALLARLSPEAVEAMAGPAGGTAGAAGALFGARERRLWEGYRRLHAQVTEQFDDDFDSAFGKEFARAYERATSARPGRR